MAVRKNGRPLTPTRRDTPFKLLLGKRVLLEPTIPSIQHVPRRPEAGGGSGDEIDAFTVDFVEVFAELINRILLQRLLEVGIVEVDLLDLGSREVAGGDGDAATSGHDRVAPSNSSASKLTIDAAPS